MSDWIAHAPTALVLPAWVLEASRTAGDAVLAVVLFLLLRWIGVRALSAVLLPLQTRARHEGETSIARLETRKGLAASSLTYILLFLAVVTLLGQLGVHVGAILAGAGDAGLALSFGAQRLVRDILTGVFLLPVDQFRFGEVVSPGGGPGLPQLTGTVLEMGLRISRLKDVSGKVVTIGNGDVAAVINHSRGPITATVELGVPPDLPIDRIKTAAAEAHLPEALFTGSAEVQGVTQLDASKMVIRLAAPAQPGRAPEAELALRLALGEALRQAEIEIR